MFGAQPEMDSYSGTSGLQGLPLSGAHDLRSSRHGEQNEGGGVQGKVRMGEGETQFKRKDS